MSTDNGYAINVLVYPIPDVFFLAAYGFLF